jgi:hypothetical protein
MKSDTRILVLKTVVTSCLALIFIYLWFNAEPFVYKPNDRFQISPTVVVGAAFLFSLVSLFSQIADKK